MKLRRRLRRLLILAGSLLVLIGAAYAGLLAYVTHREQVSPSTQRVLVLKDGRTLPLTQPTRRPASSRALPPAATDAANALPEPTPDTPLPPERIRIPAIGVDWPVVLSDNEHLPRFRGVGWLMGSASPGTVGNIVLFGHLGGPYGTFMNLHKLQAGDIFSIQTQSGEFRYTVRASYETTPDDVAPLAPTDKPTATLITCSGPWDPVAQTNARRLIVVADYVQ